MKKSAIGFFLLIAIVALMLSAEESADVTQVGDTNRLVSMIIAKQDEALENTYPDRDITLELRELYMEYFQTGESLSFDRDTFGSGEFRRFMNYISSDDGLIKVFSWETYFGRTSHPDSLVQFRSSDRKLRTTHIPQMVRESHNLERFSTFPPSSFFNEIYKLKEGVYLLAGSSGGWRGSRENFVTLELKEGEVIPYYAFKNNRMAIEGYIPMDIDLSFLPDSFDLRIVQGNDLFAIELDMLFPRDPVNIFEYVNDHQVIKEKDTFERRERFVFNGTEFVGNYWVLHEYWDRGERPVDISRFFPKIDPKENAIKERDEAEISLEVPYPLAYEENIEKKETDEPTKKKSTNNHSVLFFLLLCFVIIVYGFFYCNKTIKKKNVRLGSV